MTKYKQVFRDVWRVFTFFRSFHGSICFSCVMLRTDISVKILQDPGHKCNAPGIVELHTGPVRRMKTSRDRSSQELVRVSRDI